MSEKSTRFEKVLRSREVIALSFGAMIGWSWILMTGYWVEHAGSLGVLIAFLFGGLTILLIALTYAELVTAMPQAGGEHVYTHRALGPTWSFVCTWALLMAYVTVCLFEAVALPTAVSYLVPEVRFGYLWTLQDFEVDIGFVLIGVIATLVMTAINVLGIRMAAFVQTCVTVVILASGVVLFTGAVGFGEAIHLEPLFSENKGGILVVLIMVPALLVGFDVIPQAAEELDVPLAKIGWILVVSVACAIAWYAMISFATATSMPREILAATQMSSGDAAAALWGHPSAGVILVIGGIGGILTSWNAFIIGGSRLMYALARSGFLPSAFGQLHSRFHTPWLAILVIGILSCLAPWFGRAILVWFVNAGSFGTIVAYIFVPIAFLVLRKSMPQMARPYRVPFGRLVGVIAAVMGVSVLLMFFPPFESALGSEEWRIVGLWGTVGLLVYLFYGRKVQPIEKDHEYASLD